MSWHYIAFFSHLKYNKEKVHIAVEEDDMETELSRNIDIAKEKAQYDLLCKKILANKTVLAWIMRRTVKEYANMSIEEIKACIEGEP